jgi:hypothetical protein
MNIRTTSAAFAFVALIASWLACPPAGAVINNGVVVIRNNFAKPVEVSVMFEAAGTHVLVRQTRVNGESEQSFDTSCCLLAGSQYFIEATWASGDYVESKRFYFTPHLCNTRGIPYGYARIELNPVRREGVSTLEVAFTEVDRDGCLK